MLLSDTGAEVTLLVQCNVGRKNFGRAGRLLSDVVIRMHPTDANVEKWVFAYVFILYYVLVVV